MKRRKQPALRNYPIETAKMVAEILGPQSAAALALSELERRKAAGEDVALFTTGNSVLIVPRANFER